jgi:hypothetical protein
VDKVDQALKLQFGRAIEAQRHWKPCHKVVSDEKVWAHLVDPASREIYFYLSEAEVMATKYESACGHPATISFDARGV